MTTRSASGTGDGPDGETRLGRERREEKRGARGRPGEVGCAAVLPGAPDAVFVDLAHHEHGAAVDGPEVLPADAERGGIRFVDVDDEVAPVEVGGPVEFDEGVDQGLFRLVGPELVDRLPMFVQFVEPAVGHVTKEG